MSRLYDIQCRLDAARARRYDSGGEVGWAMDKVVSDALLSILFAVIGFVLLFLGYRVFDLLTPTDLNDDIYRKGNVAAAIFAGAFVIALAIVISHAIS